MKRLLLIAPIVAVSLCAPASLRHAQAASVQDEPETPYESEFVEVRDVRLHYLDFGGSGLPVIFVHGSHSDARNFTSFAARFADGFRALALDRRGRGESEDVPWGYDVASQGEDLLGFMDALELERAVLVGNVGGPVQFMTYLAEHHPDRLAGLVYLAHMPPPLMPHEDVAVREFWEMAMRTACDWDEQTRQQEAQRDSYRPHFADDSSLRIDVPALSLANTEGTRYPEDFSFLGFLLQHSATGEWCDPVAKEYFTALAADTVGADQLRARFAEFDREVHREAFERAFGERMTIVRLEVPAVSGYEYDEAPDLIYPPVRRFLEELNEEQDFR